MSYTLLFILFTWISSPVNDFRAFFSSSDRDETVCKLGDYVENFTLKNVDGKMVSLENEAKKGAIVVFTCNTCPFSVMYEQRIIDLDNTYRPQGYPVIAINPNDAERVPKESFAHMQKLSEEKNYPFPYLVDETQAVAKAFGAKKTPHVFLLNKEDKGLRLIYIGAIDDNPGNAEKVSEPYVEQAIQAVQQGEEVQKKTTKAIGCSIKWASASKEGEKYDKVAKEGKKCDKVAKEGKKCDKVAKEGKKCTHAHKKSKV